MSRGRIRGHEPRPQSCFHASQDLSKPRGDREEIYRTRAVMRPFAACERLRLLAPEARRGGGLRRAGGAANGLGGSRRQRELAAPESLARRRTRSVRPEGPRVVVAATLAPLGGEPSWGKSFLPHQQKRAADLRWSSSAHSECLTCGRARYKRIAKLMEIAPQRIEVGEFFGAGGHSFL